MGDARHAEGSFEDLLLDYDPLEWHGRDTPAGYRCDGVFTSGLSGGIELLYLTGNVPPHVDELRRVWRERSGNRAVPVLAVATYPGEGGHFADIVGLRDTQTTQRGLALSSVKRAVVAALDAGSTLEAERLLLPLFAQEDETGLPQGLRNEGLFAAYELTEHVPRRRDWADAGARGRALRGRRGLDLLTALGWTSRPLGASGHLLGDGDSGRAVAVLLQDDELFDRRSGRFGDASPVERGLSLAHKERVRWVVAVQGDIVRLYSASPDVGVGRKGASATFTELHVQLLDDARLAYVSLLVSPEALTSGGSVEQILDSSADHATSLGARLRDRVYKDAVPGLAQTVAERLGAVTDEELVHAYHVTLVILFRLLFVAYAEDRGLLPYRSNSEYTRVALKTRARQYAQQRLDNGKVEHSDVAFGVWRDLTDIWSAVDKGHAEWGVPAYSGGLFAVEDDRGRAIAELRLTDSEVGPALVALLVDSGKDGTYGPVDFQALSVREFGTIYEGLLESSLSIAPVALTLDERDSYVPAGPRDTIFVGAGQVYFHNASGARKATGSYFTKQFAVEHLLNTALEPAIDDHLARVSILLDLGEEAGAGEAFFDLRVADIAMGSGHFLVGAVDHIALRMSAFLADRPVPEVSAELGRLREVAIQRLTDVGVSELPEIDPANLLRRQVARRCIYGVDLNQIAVDLARLALWIHTFVPGLPMSSLDHGLVQGNALTGIGTLDEALEVLSAPPKGRRGTVSPGQIDAFEEPIRQALTASRDLLLRVKRTAEATAAEVAEAAAAHRQALVRAEPATALLDAAVAGRLGVIDLPTVAVLGAEAVIEAGRSIEVRQRVAELGALHFAVAFPEVFLRDRPGFDVILGNPPWEELTIEELAFWSTYYPGLRRLSSAAQASETDALRKTRGDLVVKLQERLDALSVLRRALLAGQFPGMSSGDPELYKAFCWRFRRLSAARSRVGVVLSRSAYLTQGSAAWRTEVLTDSCIALIYAVNEREWLFTDVNPAWPVALTTIRRGSSSPGVSVVGPIKSRKDFEQLRLREPVFISSQQLAANDPRVCVPAFSDNADAAIFAALLESPAIGAERRDFDVRAATDLHATNDGKKRFFTNCSTDHPVLNHTHIGDLEPLSVDAFNHVVFDDVQTHLQRHRERTFRRPSSPFFGTSPDWALDPRTHPLLHPRIAFRDVVHATNRRKVWVSLLPARSVLTNKAPYLVFRRGSLPAKAYLLGMLASAPINWYGHMRVGLNLNFFIFNSIPVPEFDAKSVLHSRIAELAGRLSLPALKEEPGEWQVFGEPIRSLDARLSAHCEIHAAGALAFGLPLRHLESVLRWTPDLLPTVVAHYDRWSRA